MKSKTVKKLLAAALTAGLFMVSAMNVFASGGAPDDAAETVSDETDGEISSLEDVPEESFISIPGFYEKTSLRGIYIATNLNGTLIHSSGKTVAENFGLSSNETAFAKFSNTDPEKSNLAAASLRECAAAIGAANGPMFNFELGKMAGGKYSKLDGGALTLSIGVPKHFLSKDTNYAVICVKAGGAVSVLPNLSTIHGIVTFDTTASAGSYMLVKLG